MLDATTLPRDRAAALLAGSERYFSGKPCRNGHMAPRRTRNRDCDACASARAKRQYETHGELIRARQRETYAADPVPLRERQTERRRLFPEEVRAASRAEYERHRDQYVARATRWARENPERFRDMHKRWRDKNPEKQNHWAALGRALRMARRPLWLTREHRREIRAFYAEARELTLKTGVVHEVDHIVPLRGETVSGLHVPWNLQVLTGESNRAKSNKY